MIERDPPFFYDVSCDGCSVGEERIEADEFMEVVNEIKKRGWKIMKKAGVYFQYCPDCADR